MNEVSRVELWQLLWSCFCESEQPNMSCRKMSRFSRFLNSSHKAKILILKLNKIIELVFFAVWEITTKLRTINNIHLIVHSSVGQKSVDINIFCLWSHKAEMKVPISLDSYWEVLGKNLLQGAFRFLLELISLWL